MFCSFLWCHRLNHANFVSTLHFTHVLWLGAQERRPLLLIVVMLAALLFYVGRSFRMTRVTVARMIFSALSQTASAMVYWHRIVAVSLFEADASPRSGTRGPWPLCAPRSVPSMESTCDCSATYWHCGCRQLVAVCVMHSFGLYSQCSALQFVSGPMSQDTTSGSRTLALTGRSRRTWLHVSLR